MSNPDNNYTNEEKLSAIAGGLMDPKELGLATADEAKLQLMPAAPKKVTFGTTLIFRAGVVPLELRAEWALQEQKIILPAAEAARWKADWMDANKHEYPIQGDLCCGNANARFGQTFKDPVLGLCQMLRIAADTLEAKYTEEPTPEADVKDFVPDVQAAIESGELGAAPQAPIQQDEPTIETIP